MAELLTKVDPACLSANQQAGQVVVVQENNFAWSDLERKLFVVVRVPLSVADAKARFLKEGIPDAVLNAYDQALSQAAQSVGFSADERRLPLILSKVNLSQAHKAAIINARNGLDGHASRKEYINPALIQTEINQVVSNRQVITNNHVAAKAAARAAVEAKYFELTGEQANPELKTSQLYENAQRNNDKLATALLKASKEGYDSVSKKDVEKINPHKIVELDL